MPTTSAGVAAELRAEIARQGRTITAVADSAGLVTSTLTRKLKGIHEFDVNELGRVCAVLGISASELLDRAERGAA
jgi:transcriptional regulator with XRE-family HTH domain